ncbi:thioredoxin domain-containing protein [Pseudomonas kitaguniensis]|uniref:thioredoxin domain-containing protein n=1 Tax=Pseudomonas kitaguniensis TaxID=2607908 RepID=UPI003D037665
MGTASTAISDIGAYQQLLDEHPLVIVLFTSPYCAACQGAHLRFNRIAEKYVGRVRSVLLDTTQTPKIEGVDGTPTLVVYKNALEVENLKGIGEPQEQEELLEQVFSDYAPSLPATLESPAAPPPPPR